MCKGLKSFCGFTAVSFEMNMLAHFTCTFSSYSTTVTVAGKSAKMLFFFLIKLHAANDSSGFDELPAQLVLSQHFM